MLLHLSILSHMHQVMSHRRCLVQALIQNFVRSTLTLTFVIAAARVVFNIKAQMMEERRWEMELRAEVLTHLYAASTPAYWVLFVSLEMQPIL